MDVAWRPDNRDVIPAAQVCGAIRSLSSLLQFTTQLRDMETGPAKACVDGHCEKHFTQIRKNAQAWSPSVHPRRQYLSPMTIRADLAITYA